MHWFTLVFLATLALTTAARLWLSSRNIRHIAAKRTAVPAEFAGRISLAAHQKAAAYSIAKARLGLIETLVAAALTLVLTLGGGLQFLSGLCERVFQLGGYGHGIALIVLVIVVSSAVDLPSSLYRTFAIEARFGFNRMSLRLFIIDLLKVVALGALVGIPLVFVVLWLMARMGGFWWIAVWLVDVEQVLLHRCASFAPVLTCYTNGRAAHRQRPGRGRARPPPANRSAGRQVGLSRLVN